MLGLGFLCLAAFPLLCPGAERDATRSDAALSGAAHGGDVLTVFFTGETRGNLVPCACRERPWGGVARRAGFLEERRREGRGTIFLLDAGGFLPEGETRVHAAPGAADRLVSLLLDGMIRSGVQATALDCRQRAFLALHAPDETAALGRALLQADPPDPARLLHWGSEPVAILALEETSDDSTVIRAGREARDRANLLFVLARADAFTGRRLARLSGADLVILSRGARTAGPLREGEAVLVGCGTEGKELGEVRFALTPGSDFRLSLVSYRLHPMDASVPQDEQLARKTDELLQDPRTRPLVIRATE